VQFGRPQQAADVIGAERGSERIAHGLGFQWG
jgi:hypothetical protein